MTYSGYVYLLKWTQRLVLFKIAIERHQNERLQLLLLKCLLTAVLISGSMLSSAQHIQYTHRDHTLSQIIGSDIEWMTYEKPILEGLDNGIYWFKIELSRTDQTQFIRLPSAHLIDCQLYRDHESIPVLPKTRYYAFEIAPLEKEATFYLKVDAIKEAFIPITISTDQAYQSSKNRNLYIYFAFYGFMLAIILFSLISFFQYRDHTYLLYILLTIGVNWPPAIHEGLFSFFLSPTTVNFFLEPLSHLLCGIFSALFTYQYLNLSQDKNRFIPIVGTIMGIGFLAFLSYLYSRSYELFISLDILMMIVLTVCMSYGIMNFTRNDYAKFFTIALFPLLIAAYDFYIFPAFGFKLLGLTLDQYRIGNVIELVVFTIAIGYRGRMLSTEKEKMQQKIQLLTENKN